MRRAFAKAGLDIALWSLVVPLAFWLRLESVRLYWADILAYALIGVPVKLSLITFFGLPRRGWRNVDIRDLVILAQAVGVACIGLFSIGFLLNPYLFLPRSVPVIEGALAVLVLCGARLIARLYHESMLRRMSPGGARRTVIVGAGEAGTMIVRELGRHPEAGIEPVAFLDDDPTKRQHNIYDVPVLGKIADLPRVVRETRAQEVLIAIPSAPGSVVRGVVELAREAGIASRTVPSLYDLITEKVLVSQIREVDVEDLLRREPVRLNLERIAGYLKNRTVLITGAGGSIGCELVNQVARFGPRRVILLGRGENSMFDAERRIAATWPDLERLTVVADVRNREKVRGLFAELQPEVVFHTAAHKHVPMMEHNADEAVFNNVGGTLNLVEAALENGTDYFVNISTDKAVNPTSIMGATKRAAEYVVMRAAMLAPPGRTFVSVRFGNVLGSRGSVIPLFREQIKKGGPVTVTHPDMQRYFMTIPEAAQLVLQAAGHDENGKVYVLDMGEPVNIMDLARDMIRFSGLEPGEDIPIVTTGVRPGEKLFEEYLTAEEGTEATRDEKIFTARLSGLPDDFDSFLEHLFAAARGRDDERIRQALSRLVPSFGAQELNHAFATDCPDHAHRGDDRRSAGVSRIG